jgi:plastocyanin
MKKFFVVLAILFVGILLAGCTSQPAAPVATATPTPVPTAVPTTAAITAVPTTEVIVVVVNQTPNATPTATPTPRPTVVITFNNDLTITPDPSIIRVPVGTKVIWVNADEFKPHAVQAINVQTAEYFGGMGTVTVPYGSPLEVIFDKEGAYDYKTVFQQEMDCKIIVYK